ncbi:MAG: hypothetical protein ACI92A_000150 [Candidatus Paceibacteria bacterium]|jgi:hypothetical protein
MALHTAFRELLLFVFSLLTCPAQNVRRFEASKMAGFQAVEAKLDGLTY